MHIPPAVAVAYNYGHNRKMEEYYTLGGCQYLADVACGRWEITRALYPVHPLCTACIFNVNEAGNTTANAQQLHT